MNKIIEQSAQFHAKVGECITAWASIEQLLYGLFKVALGADDDVSASLFWTFPTFSMRLSYTGLIVEKVMEEKGAPPSKRHLNEGEKAWKDLKSKIVDMYSFRNNVAHQPVPTNETKIDSRGAINITVPIVDKIYPNPFNDRKRFSPIGIDDLYDQINKAHHLRLDIEGFISFFSSRRAARDFQ